MALCISTLTARTRSCWPSTWSPTPRPPPHELADRCEESGVESRLVRDRRVTAADLAAVRVALDEWLRVVDAPDEQTRVRLANEMLAKYTEHPRLTNHAYDGWHMHYRPDDVPVGRLVATLISTGTALHLAWPRHQPPGPLRHRRLRQRVRRPVPGRSSALLQSRLRQPRRRPEAQVEGELKTPTMGR